jgi:acylphosphatase
MIVHKNVHVMGKVQGVFYRASTVDKAKSLGLMGFVLNETGGSVYMEIEGEDTDVNQMIEWARKGPPRAMVDKLQITDGAVIGFKTFEIRR